MTARPYSILAVALGAVSCGHGSSGSRVQVALTSPSVLCKDPTLSAKAFCLPAVALEKLLRDGAMSILFAREPKHGTTGARLLYLEFPKEKVILRAKWKEANPGGGGINNDPRKELAAYAFQKLLLQPADYVVPPTVGRCIPIEYYQIQVKGQNNRTVPTFPDTHCVFGTVSYWLENATELDGFERQRFASDRAYRWTVANLNLITHLINHRDTRPSNFLVSSDRDNPRAFAIDNGLAFSGLTNPRTILLREWSQIMVPALPHEQIDKLRKIARGDLDRLAVVAQFAVRSQQLDPVDPTEPISLDSGVRRSGDAIQLGLTRSEIDGIEGRIKDLLREVDTGRTNVF